MTRKVRPLSESAGRLTRGDRAWVTLGVTLLTFIVAIASFVFFVHKTSTAIVYNPAYDRQSVLRVSGLVYDLDELSQTTGLPVPVARTVSYFQTEYRDNGWHVHVFVHGANIMVTFPHEPAICVWVPAIVNGPKEPSIVSC